MALILILDILNHFNTHQEEAGLLNNCVYLWPKAELDGAERERENSRRNVGTLADKVTISDSWKFQTS